MKLIYNLNMYKQKYQKYLLKFKIRWQVKNIWKWKCSTRKKLKTLETANKETTQKLNDVTEEYNKREQQLRERLVSLYEAGSISYLDVLLSARTLSEFLSKYYKMIEIMEYDNQLIDTVEKEKMQWKLQSKLR